MKVFFGFKNAYYAPVTENEGVYTYGTPVRLPGAVGMTLEPSGETNEFFADDGLFFSNEDNKGYEGSIELAKIPKSFRKDILGQVEDANGVLFEEATAINKPFALLCEFTADDGASRFVFYNCMARRPSISGTTKGENINVQTQTLNLIIRPNLNGTVKCDTDESTDPVAYNNWYTQVYTKTEISA